MTKCLFQTSQITTKLLNVCGILTFTNSRLIQGRSKSVSRGSRIEFYPENTFESGTINIVLWHFSQDSMNTAMKSFNFWQWIGINWDTYNYKGRFYSQFRLITYQYKRCKTFLIFDIVAMVLVLLQPHQQPYQLR